LDKLGNLQRLLIHDIASRWRDEAWKAQPGPELGWVEESRIKFKRL